MTLLDDILQATLDADGGQRPVGWQNPVRAGHICVPVAYTSALSTHVNTPSVLGGSSFATPRPIRYDLDGGMLTRDAGCGCRVEIVSDTDGIRYVDVHHHEEPLDALPRGEIAEAIQVLELAAGDDASPAGSLIRVRTVLAEHLIDRNDD